MWPDLTLTSLQNPQGNAMTCVSRRSTVHGLVHDTQTGAATRVPWGANRRNTSGGILFGMPDSTTIKVSVRTRDALRELADREGLTFDAQIEKLVRRERRRIIGAQLASAPLDAGDEAVLDASASDVADASG